MAPAPEEGRLPPSLRLLQALVILLTLSMIGGVIAVVWLLVTRMPAALEAGPALPPAITLPEGETASAITFGKAWVAVVTESGRVLVYAPDGRLRQELAITP